MIDFMVVALPRSATAWVANWLNTDSVFCLHDPLYPLHYLDWDSDTSIFPKKNCETGYTHTGVACTGIWRWPEFLDSHPAKKVFIDRDLRDINYSLDRLGMPRISQPEFDQFRSAQGLRVDYKNLFRQKFASQVVEHLFEGAVPINWLRYRELSQLKIEKKSIFARKNRPVYESLCNELSIKNEF